MIVSLALRNTVKNLPKRLPLGILFALTIGLLFLGNTIFENTDRGFETAYVNSFTGDLALTVRGDSQFTIFGSDLPLIGEYFVLPVLPNFAELSKVVKERAPDLQTIGQISAGGQLAFEGYESKVPVFGVEFADYFRFFPSLKLVKGTIPESGSSSILVNSWKYAEMNERLGRVVEIGSKMTISIALENTFVIREVVLAGVYDYPVKDEVLSKIVLTDVDTARALNGYIYGAVSENSRSETTSIDTDDLDSLFDTASDVQVDAANGISLTDVEKLLSQTQERTAMNRTVEGAWNFLLVKTPSAKDETRAAVQSALAVRYPELEVRSWRETAGGNAQTVWLIRLLFNAGIIFIAFGACLIVINSLALSIVERTKEIGTMRALGAQKSTIAGLVLVEIVLLVSGAGFVGIFLGIGAALLTLVQSVPIDNAFLASLFGTNALSLTVSWSTIAFHLVLCVALGFLSVILPVQRALKIDPTKAMSRE